MERRRRPFSSCAWSLAHLPPLIFAIATQVSSIVLVPDIVAILTRFGCLHTGICAAAVRIVTAAIDPDVNEIAICPGIGDFRSRYFNSNSGNIVVSHDNTDQDATRARAPKSNFTI